MNKNVILHISKTIFKLKTIPCKNQQNGYLYVPDKLYLVISNNS